jgi:hypothetical protein
MPCFQLFDAYHLNKKGYHSYMFANLQTLKTKPVKLSLHDIGSFTVSHGKKIIILAPDHTPNERSDLETHAKGVCVLSFHHTTGTSVHFRVHDLAFHPEVPEDARTAFVKSFKNWGDEILWAESALYSAVWDNRFKFDMVISVPGTASLHVTAPISEGGYELCQPGNAYADLFPASRVYLYSTSISPQSPSRDGPLYRD